MTTWLPIAAGILAVFFWAISFVAIKIALPEMRPVTIIFLRQFIERWEFSFMGLISDLLGGVRHPSSEGAPSRFQFVARTFF